MIINIKTYYNLESMMLLKSGQICQLTRIHSTDAILTKEQKQCKGDKTASSTEGSGSKLTSTQKQERADN